MPEPEPDPTPGLSPSALSLESPLCLKSVPSTFSSSPSQLFVSTPLYSSSSLSLILFASTHFSAFVSAPNIILGISFINLPPQLSFPRHFSHPVSYFYHSQAPHVSVSLHMSDIFSPSLLSLFVPTSVQPCVPSACRCHESSRTPRIRHYACQSDFVTPSRTRRPSQQRLRGVPVRVHNHSACPEAAFDSFESLPSSESGSVSSGPGRDSLKLPFVEFHSRSACILTQVDSLAFGTSPKRRSSRSSDFRPTPRELWRDCFKHSEQLGSQQPTFQHDSSMSSQAWKPLRQPPRKFRAPV